MKRLASIILALTLYASLCMTAVSPPSISQQKDVLEFSPAAASMAYSVDSKSATAWKKVSVAGTTTKGAKLPRTYCVDAGLSPRASEGWHFNDLDARSATKFAGTGGFAVMGNVSFALG